MSPTIKPLPTVERLRGLLRYEPATGDLFWLVNASQMRAGSHAGDRRLDGYRRLQVDGCRLLAHRVDWALMTGGWPDSLIDHVNGLPGDDRWANLREATSHQNQANQRRRADNTSGFKGVHWSKSSQKWQAMIRVDGRRRHLGYFDSREDAHAAYVAAAIDRFGEFARAA